MAIKLDCPRCKNPLSVPKKKIDSYVKCPRCGGRFWASEELVPTSRTTGQNDTPSPTVSIGGAATVAPGEIVSEPAGDQGNRAGRPPDKPSGDGGSEASWHVLASAPPPASGGSRSSEKAAKELPGKEPKTARLISANATESPLQLAEDGQLPELQLREGPRKENRKEEKTSRGNPLLLFGLLSVSMVICVALLVFDPGLPQTPQKERARNEIEAKYFPREGETPEEYQEYLMKAHRAATRGNRDIEREMYEAVLTLLRQERPAYAEDGGKEWSLTRSPESDERLKKLLAELLSD